MTSTPTLSGQDIGQAERATRAVLDALLEETATTFHQSVALDVLAAGLTSDWDQLVGQMASRLKIDESIAVSTVEQLDELGMVTTTASEPRSVELTNAGQDRYQQLSIGVEGITQRLYGDIPVDDLATAHRVLVLVTERANAELRQTSTAASSR